MNLFRSEENVRAWAAFDPQTEKAIKPVREWAAILAGLRITQRRLDKDFVEMSEEYINEGLPIVAEALR